MMTPQQKAERIGQLRRILFERLDFYRKKERFARTNEKQDYWRERARRLNQDLWRSFGLADLMLKPRKLGETSVLWQGWAADNWKKYEAKRKQKGRGKFLNTHYYAPWFMSTSLGADYGKYTCDRCEQTFYHSPSKITKAGKVLYACSCGYCTNTIIERDHGHEPYQ